jgi:hypothetical protein
MDPFALALIFGASSALMALAGVAVAHAGAEIMVTLAAGVWAGST